jgi:hypothetical protein
MFAQQSMLEGNPVWVYQQEIIWRIKNAPENVKRVASEPFFLFHTYSIKGDTTIQGKVYKKLYHEYQNEKGEYLFGTNGAELVTPLREDGNKIFAPRSFFQKQWGDADWYYEMVGSTDDEIVIYDFDMLKEGKVTIEQKGQIFSHFIITTVEKRLSDKTLHQVYQFGSDKDETSQQETLLEITDGIGCNKDNVLLFAPFADDGYLVPDEVDVEMEHITSNLPAIYFETDKSGSITSTVQWFRCTWEWGGVLFLVYDYNHTSFDDSWVKTFDDGKMMVTLEKFLNQPSSFLGYYVQNGKIIYQDTRALNYGYRFIEKYLEYHINEEKEMVDLGLSVKWSTHNVGAASATDFGQYFCWGDTTGISPSDNNQEVPYTGHYLEFENRLQNHIAKTKFDAAYLLQGKNWRMPTVAEYKELIDKCACVEIFMNNVEGYLLTGPNGNTLFLPKAERMYQTNNGMLHKYYNYDNNAIYWTEELVDNTRGHKDYVYVYMDNQLDMAYRYNSQNYPLKALPIRAVYDESGDKWLSVNEYLYYNRYDLIEWGWDENDVVIPTVEACNDFIARHQELFGLGKGQDQKMSRYLFTENFRNYVADRLEIFKSRAVDTYEGSDGKTLYFVDQIDDDLLNVFDTKLGQIDLMAAINLEEDNTGNGAYTKNCTYTVENLNPQFGVPGNQYLHVIPASGSAQPYIGFNLPSLLANTNYTIRIMMAPEALDSVEHQGNQFRINMFIKTAEGQWPRTRNYVVANPIDPTGRELSFTSSGDTLTVIDIPLTLDYATDVMIQLQSYVSTKELKTYTRHLRIANIEVINNGKDVPPMITEQKMWKVAWFPMSTSKTPQMVATYYFEGDTIVNGQIAKRMLCDQVAASEWEWLNISKEYVGAWYEQDKQVYCALPSEDQFRKLYDFTTNMNEQFFIYNRQIGSDEEGYLKGLQTGANSNFKGISHVIWSYPNATSWSTTWMEGVGGFRVPTDNICNEASGYKLISCIVGDEVIYLDEQLEADIPTGPSYAKKRRFDFNHTVKTQPKVPRRAEELNGVYGEYNDELLDVKLNPLEEAYIVRITDKSDKAVYEKTINAGNIVALNIDISEYPDGQYTVTIDNSKETFTGEFEINTTGIEEQPLSPLSQGKGAMFNLQGQRISAPQKGINIIGGKKVWVK